MAQWSSRRSSVVSGSLKGVTGQAWLAAEGSFSEGEPSSASSVSVTGGIVLTVSKLNSFTDDE